MNRLKNIKAIMLGLAIIVHFPLDCFQSQSFVPFQSSPCYGHCICFALHPMLNATVFISKHFNPCLVEAKLCNWYCIQ